MIIIDDQVKYFRFCVNPKVRVLCLEKQLSKNGYHACKYAELIFRGRWPHGEKEILKDPYDTLWYAQDVIKGRWPEGEVALDAGALTKEEYKFVKANYQYQYHFGIKD